MYKDNEKSFFLHSGNKNTNGNISMTNGLFFSEGATISLLWVEKPYTSVFDIVSQYPIQMMK